MWVHFYPMNPADLSRLIENLIRTGTIAEVDHGAALCRVKTGAITTAWLPYFERRAGNTRTWNPPTEGEQCVVLSPSGELAAGLVLVGLYSTAHPAPSADPEMHIVEYPDGAAISYNHSTGQLNASGIKSAIVQAADSITVDCPQSTFTGNVIVNGLFTYTSGMVGSGGETTAQITGDVVADGVSLKNHRHSGVQPGGGNTGEPL